VTIDTPKYDRRSQESIYEHAKNLEGRTLRDVLKECNKEHIARTNRKGSFGQMIEKGYFYIDNNSDVRPDFYEVGIELKTTPMKRLKNGTYASKERLILSIINYMKLLHQKFDGSFLKKNKKLLIIFYLFEEGHPHCDYRILRTRLWEFPEEDLRIIRDDWNKIAKMVEEGRADELSERHTMYLGAARKGSGHGKDMRKQPHSMDLAPQRAFSLKQTYVNKMWNASSDAEYFIKNLDQWSDDLTFEDIVLRRFEPFEGMYCDDIERMLDVRLNPKAKSYHADLARRMMGINGKRIEEFENANVYMKTMRLQKSGMPKEDMVFPHFDYLELVRTNWEGSEIYRNLNRRFFFPIFRIDGNRTYFERAMFWSISKKDLEAVRTVWEETVQRVNAGRTDLPKIRENKVAHVRPHARDSRDKISMPDGTEAVKKAFWLSKKFVKEQIQNQSDVQ
jgi:DNA mismatch repair protein MutH